jgi:hypothetical protein
VLTLILILLLLWFLLGGLLAAWTFFFQGYIYSEPATGVWWRAAAAGTALAAVICLWVVIDYRATGRYRTIFEFTGQEQQKPYTELRIRRDGREEVYVLRKDERGRPEYRDAKDPRRLFPHRPEKIVAIEDGQQHVYLPERDAKGNFKRQTGGSLRYYEEGNPGHYMVEEQWGRVTDYHFGRLVLDLFLNVLHLAVWWAVLWLLLRFQWSHALGLAVAFWAAMTLFVLPPLLTRAEDVARQRAETKVAAFSAPPVAGPANASALRPGFLPLDQRLGLAAEGVETQPIVPPVVEKQVEFRPGPGSRAEGPRPGEGLARLGGPAAPLLAQGENQVGGGVEDVALGPWARLPGAFDGRVETAGAVVG